MHDGHIVTRVVPEDWTDVSSRILFMPNDASWNTLGRMLDETHPKCIGILLPLVSQLHRYVYREARARGITVALVPPSNAMVLTGLMEEVPIEAVVADEHGARLFAEDLQHMGLLSRVRGWLIISPKGKESSYAPQFGVVFRDSFL